MSPQEIYSLILWLPDDSALSASIRGGREYMGWTWDRIVATLLLEVQENIRVDFIKAHTPKESARKITSPPPIPFPGRPKPKAKDSGNMLPIVRALARGGKPPVIK